MDNSAQTPKATAIVDLAEMQRASKLMSDVADKWCTVPALNYVLMTFADGTLTMRATDLDIDAETTVEADCSGNAVVTINYRTLRSFVSAISGPVMIEVYAGGSNDPSDQITLAEGDLKLRLRSVIPADDFPPRQPFPDTASHWTMSQDSLMRLVNTCWHCISTEETRYYLNGIYLHVENGNLRAVATDGHRLACVDSSEKPTLDEGMILPTPLLKLLRSLMKKAGNEPVMIKAAPNAHKIEVLLSGVSIRAKTIDDTYPDYRRVIPSGPFGIRSTLNRTQILRLAKTASGLTKNNPGAEIDPRKGRLSVKAFDGDAVSVPIKVETEIEGQLMPFGFNLGYLRKQAEATPVFTLHGTDRGSPFILRGEDPTTLFVLMPMRID
ncbi:hypothetical protein DL1_11800 [Thioclava dalianensis]|uniref:Beta sliding clamp n=2 Tax=Thioclava dalianensis TaxID=1185766 RepID=A0A074T9Q7_9RHOB|nr:hypothetical protein DL1_11800 [Thioclava dalianensis]